MSISRILGITGNDQIIHTYHAIAAILENDPGPTTIQQCRERSDWPNGEEAIKAELSILFFE
ncbi:hypothetical protein BKA69DRAFT_1071673 [Paraphysoderma sedebokerense]|nr:hypothetical protein BKA69DRAFT_1071673 [Paraphysoderma sedebokerense]